MVALFFPLFCAVTPWNVKHGQILAKSQWSLSWKCVSSVNWKWWVSGDNGLKVMPGSTRDWWKISYPAVTCDWLVHVLRKQQFCTRSLTTLSSEQTFLKVLLCRVHCGMWKICPLPWIFNYPSLYVCRLYVSSDIKFVINVLQRQLFWNKYSVSCFPACIFFTYVDWSIGVCLLKLILVCLQLSSTCGTEIVICIILFLSLLK